ncbi:MAG: DUF3109 family protein [Bacteroidetes bacterium]|nr:DUF3109 family protein [Bacteroidota bacterium]
MFVIDESLVSDYLKTVKFCCDLPHCLGSCCVEGDAGAPLEPEELKMIAENLDKLIEYMTLEGVQWVEKYGVSDFDPAGNLVTPLLEGKECAYAYFDGEIARCAMEKSFEAGQFPLKKPISCHLYPVRIKTYNTGDAVNYHQWHVCQPALVKGRNEEIPLYVFLKEALVRKYGQEWYDELVNQIEKKNL